MKTISIGFVLLIFFVSCTKEKKDDINKAQIIYLYNLDIVHDYVFQETWKDTPNRSIGPAIHFLEDLTSIESYRTKDVVNLPEPSEQNYEDWKFWYLKNKNNIYWDKKAYKIKVKD